VASWPSIPRSKPPPDLRPHARGAAGFLPVTANARPVPFPTRPSADRGARSRGSGARPKRTGAPRSWKRSGEEPPVERATTLVGPRGDTPHRPGKYDVCEPTGSHAKPRAGLPAGTASFPDGPSRRPPERSSARADPRWERAPRHIVGARTSRQDRVRSRRRNYRRGRHPSRTGPRVGRPSDHPRGRTRVGRERPDTSSGRERPGREGCRPRQKFRNQRKVRRHPWSAASPPSGRATGSPPAGR